MVYIDTINFEHAIGEVVWYFVDDRREQLYVFWTSTTCVLIAFVGSLRWTWKEVESLSLYSWTNLVSTHARSCMVSTRRVTVLGTHTWRLAVRMVVRVQSQTQQLPTCLRRSLTILIQNVMRNVSISLKNRLLTCVDTIWPGVIHVGTVGMVLHNARVIKSLDLTLMRVKAVMKMWFSQGPIMLAQIPPNHETIALCVAVLFLRFNWDRFFCPLFKPILCVLCIWMSYRSWVSSFKMLYLVWTNVFLFHPVLSYLIKVDVQNSHWYSSCISCIMCGKLDCADRGIECPYRHHGALYDDVIGTHPFRFFH